MTTTRIQHRRCAVSVKLIETIKQHFFSNVVIGLFTIRMHVQEDVSYFTVKSILSICALEASISTSFLCMLNVGQGLAFRLFLMSQIMLVGPPLKIRFSVSTEIILHV